MNLIALAERKLGREEEGRGPRWEEWGGAREEEGRGGERGGKGGGERKEGGRGEEGGGEGRVSTPVLDNTAVNGNKKGKKKEQFGITKEFALNCYRVPVRSLRGRKLKERVFKRLFFKKGKREEFLEAILAAELLFSCFWRAMGLEGAAAIVVLFSVSFCLSLYDHLRSACEATLPWSQNSSVHRLAQWRVSSVM